MDVTHQCWPKLKELYAKKASFSAGKACLHGAREFQRQHAMSTAALLTVAKGGDHPSVHPQVSDDRTWSLHTTTSIQPQEGGDPTLVRPRRAPRTRGRRRAGRMGQTHGSSDRRAGGEPESQTRRAGGVPGAGAGREGAFQGVECQCGEVVGTATQHWECT